MDAFQKGLSRPIPMEKAASFFVGMKTWQQPAPAVMREVKEAAMSPEEAMRALHQAGYGGLGDDQTQRQNAYIMGRAQDDVEALRSMPENAPRRSAKNIGAGALLGGLAGAGLAPHGTGLKGLAIGGGLGALAGGGLGALVKNQPKSFVLPKDAPHLKSVEGSGSRGLRMYFNQDFLSKLPPEWQNAPLMELQPKQASLLSLLHKVAAENEEPIQPGAAMSSPTPNRAPAQEEYLANEAQGLEAENNTAVEYYQGLLEQLRGEAATAQQTAQEAEERAQQLEAAQAEHDSQMSAAQQEGQIAQQAAMQQVQSANAAASTAMQQAVDAENRALQSKTTETTAKIQQQQLRSQLLDLAAQGLPGTEPELGGEGNAAEGLAPEQPSPAGPEAGAAPAEGAEGQEATAAAGPGAGGLNQQGQPANAEGMPGQEASPEAAGAAAPGTQAQPPGDTSGGAGSGSGAGPQTNTDGQPAQPEQDPTAKRQGQVSIKVGHFGNPNLISLLDRLEGEQRLPLAVGR